MIAALVLSSLLSSLVTISDLALQGMRKEEQDNDVRLAATQALYNAIEFASTNFRNETERNYLMQVLSQFVGWRAKVCTSVCCAIMRTPMGCCLLWDSGDISCINCLEACNFALVSPVSLLLDNALHQRWLISTSMCETCVCYRALRHSTTVQHMSGRLQIVNSYVRGTL